MNNRRRRSSKKSGYQIIIDAAHAFEEALKNNLESFDPSEVVRLFDDFATQCEARMEEEFPYGESQRVAMAVFNAATQSADYVQPVFSSFLLSQVGRKELETIVASKGLKIIDLSPQEQAVLQAQEGLFIGTEQALKDVLDCAYNHFLILRMRQFGVRIIGITHEIVLDPSDQTPIH